MNLEMENPVAEATETVASVEILPEELLPTLRKPGEFSQALQGYQAHGLTLIPTDPKSLKQCASFVLVCKGAEKLSEACRKAEVDPLNKQVKDINENWMPISKGFEAIWRAVDGRVSRYIYEQQQEAARLQQIEIDRANRERAELQRKEDEARAAAAAAVQAGDTKAAAKQEAKAELLSLKAENVVTDVVAATPKTIDLGGATLSAKAPVMDWIFPAWDKAKPIRCIDPRLYALIGDLDKLPEGVRFVLQHSEMTAVLLNASHKAGVVKFPKPFAEVPKFGGSVMRGGK